MWRTFHLTAGRRAISAAAIVMAVAITGCGTGAIDSKSGEKQNAVPDPAAPSAAAGSGGDSERADDPRGLAELADRRIIKTGEITLEVEDVAAVAGEVRALAVELGGYVGGSRSGSGAEAAILTLRVPAERFDQALQRLDAMEGEVRAEATREEDVTSAVIDLEARIRNLEASEAQYRSLVGRAEDVDDILAVQTRLDDVRGQIEQLKAQLEQLSRQASLATLTVTLVPRSEPVGEAAAAWDPGDTFDRALAALVGFGQAVGNVLIWLAVIGLPIGLLAAILVWVVARSAPAVRRRLRSGLSD